MSRKLFRTILSFILAISLLSAPQMAVFAEDEGEAAQTQQAEEHIASTPEFIDIPVEIKWEDEGREDERFSKIKVDLLRDGEVVESMIFTSENDWKGRFEKQPKYRTDEEGNTTENQYEYTVKEDMKYKPKGGMTVEDCYTCIEKLADGTWVITNTPNDYYMPVTPRPKAVTTLDGDNPGDVQFTFELYSAEGELVDSVMNNGEEVEFAPMELGSPGEYTFIMKEKVEREPGIAYDVTEYSAVIEMVEEKGELKSRVTYMCDNEKLENGELPTFKHQTVEDHVFVDADDDPDGEGLVMGDYEEPTPIHKSKKNVKKTKAAKASKANKANKAYSSPTGDKAPVQMIMTIGLIAMIVALGAIFFRKRRLS